MLENIREIEENDMLYYAIPSGYPLFKATKTYDPASNGLYLDPNGYYFFGVKDENPGYIKSYEKEYGIIFEFVTNRPYKLLAIDKKETQEKLYANAPSDIKNILQRNYGYTNGLRNSETSADHTLSEYICSIGYQGYAIKYMPTSFQGSFHPEFMFCDIRGIDYVKKVTSDDRVAEILQTKKLDDLSRQVEEDRKNKRQRRQSNNYDNENNENNENNETTTENNLGQRLKPKSLFMDDDEGELGGAKRRPYRRQKTNKKRRKTTKKSTTNNKIKTKKSKHKGKYKKNDFK
jgi:hypothetical protein